MNDHVAEPFRTLLNTWADGWIEVVCPQCDEVVAVMSLPCFCKPCDVPMVRVEDALRVRLDAAAHETA